MDSEWWVFPGIFAFPTIFLCQKKNPWYLKHPRIKMVLFELDDSKTFGKFLFHHFHPLKTWLFKRCRRQIHPENSDYVTFPETTGKYEPRGGLP